MPNQPTPVILSSEQVAEIEAANQGCRYLYVDALCATVRALRAENELAEKVFKFILPNRPLATVSELAKPALDEVDALREQLAEVRINYNSLRDSYEELEQNFSKLVTERDNYRERLLQATETEVEI